MIEATLQAMGKKSKKVGYMYLYNCLTLGSPFFITAHLPVQLFGQLFQFPLLATPSPSHLTTANAEGDKGC